jgi:hypothetical protein
MKKDKFDKKELKLLKKIVILEGNLSEKKSKKLQSLRKKLIKHRLENQQWWKDSTFWY